MTPMFEPSDSQECKDMLIEAYQISEKYDIPVLIRMTTRVCHSKGMVELGERREVPIKPYAKNIKKYVATPANMRPRKVGIQQNRELLREFSNNCPWNRAEYNDTAIGIICSGGDCYLYAQEVFGETASYLKLGFTNPLPDQLIQDLRAKLTSFTSSKKTTPPTSKLTCARWGSNVTARTSSRSTAK